MCDLLRRFALTAVRFYRRYPGRKRIQVEKKIKSPKRYEELRGPNHAILLQGNLFTPESAGPRELSMLCFKLVNMCYADSSILLRYVQCAIRIQTKLRIKHVALIMQSVSKYIAKNSSVLADASDNSFESEVENREKLLTKVLELVEVLSPNMFRLFARAVPKDLGMVALSLVTICEHSAKELDITQYSGILKATETTLKEIADAIGPKLPFCELPEYAALAKAYCKMPLHAEYAEMFLLDLASEIACLLNENVDHLKSLINGTYIGDDLVEELAALPRELATIACTMSRRIKHQKMWQMITQCVEMMLKLGNGQCDLFSTLDGQTMVLLATSMSRHADVSFLLTALIENKREPIKPEWAIIAIGLAQRTLKDDSLAQVFWDAIDFSKVRELEDVMKAQLVHAATKMPDISDERLDILRSFCNHESTPELQVALYAARNRLNIEPSIEMMDCIVASLGKLAVGNLIILLKNSDETSGMKPYLMTLLQEKVDDIHLHKVYQLLLYFIENHGDETATIEKMVSRIAVTTSLHDRQDIALLIHKLNGVGFNCSRFFNKSVIDRANQQLCSQDAEVVCENTVDFEDGMSIAPRQHDREEVYIDLETQMKLRDHDDAEIKKLSNALRSTRITNRKSTTVNTS